VERDDAPLEDGCWGHREGADSSREVKVDHVPGRHLLLQKPPDRTTEVENAKHRGASSRERDDAWVLGFGVSSTQNSVLDSSRVKILAQSLSHGPNTACSSFGILSRDNKDIHIKPIPRQLVLTRDLGFTVSFVCYFAQPSWITQEYYYLVRKRFVTIA
jgi:hypothetical protein